MSWMQVFGASAVAGFLIGVVAESAIRQCKTRWVKAAIAVASILAAVLSVGLPMLAAQGGGLLWSLLGTVLGLPLGALIYCAVSCGTPNPSGDANPLCEALSRINEDTSGPERP